jgi:hypothetical protein
MRCTLGYPVPCGIAAHVLQCIRSAMHAVRLVSPKHMHTASSGELRHGTRLYGLYTNTLFLAACEETLADMAFQGPV